MIRSPILGTLGIVGLAALGLTKLALPTVSSDTENMPLIVNMPASKIAHKLQSASVENFYRAAHGSNDRFPGYIRSATSVDKDNAVHFTLRLGGDLVMKADANLIEFKNGQTQIDIDVDLTESRFTRSEALNSGDEATLEAMIDVMITEYVASVVNNTPMASEKEIERQVYNRTGLSSFKANSFGDRIKNAFEVSYGRDLELAAQRESQYSRGGYSDYNTATSYGSGRFGDPTMIDSYNRPHYGGGGTDAAAAADAAVREAIAASAD